MSNPSISRRLLFLPGALGDGAFWDPLARELQFHADRTLITYPGFAGAPPDPSINSFNQLVDLILSRIDSPTALIAQSMGGVLAIEAAIRKRTLITHLILIATSGGLDTSRLGAADWRHDFKRDHPDLPEWFTSYNSDLTSELATLTVPVLLIWGDCDPISPIAIGKLLLAHFQNVRLCIVSGGEHDLARVHAQSIAPLIDALLKSINFENYDSLKSRCGDRLCSQQRLGNAGIKQ